MLHDRSARLGGRRRGGERKLHDEGRALAFFRADGEPTIHPADELAADVEAEPRPADAARELGIDPVELAEDPLLLPVGDAEALVRDREPEVRGVRLDADLDRAAVR